MSYDFQLTTSQIRVFEQWRVVRKKIIPGIQAATGGRWSFEFIPTSIELVIYAIDNEDGTKLDLTEVW